MKRINKFNSIRMGGCHKLRLGCANCGRPIKSKESKTLCKKCSRLTNKNRKLEKNAKFR